MKKLFAIAALLVGSLAAAAGASAQTVVGTDGVKVLGTDSALAVRVFAGNGSTEALYGSGWQPIADDAAKTKLGKLIAACGAACLTVDGNYEIKAVAVGRSNGVYCISNKSSIAFPNLGQPLEIADSCAFWQKVKANSQ